MPCPSPLTWKITTIPGRDAPKMLGSPTGGLPHEASYPQNILISISQIFKLYPPMFPQNDDLTVGLGRSAVCSCVPPCGRQITECGGVEPRTGSREVDVVASPNDDRRKKEDVSEISARAQASPRDAILSRANVICSRVVLFSHYLFNVSRLFFHYSSNIVRLFCRYFARLFIVNRRLSSAL